MRIQVPARRLAIFGALLALALVLFLPMRLMLGGLAEPLSAREATGTIWSGRLMEAWIGPAALGDLEARLAFLPLLTGRARIEVERDSVAPDRFAGAFVLGANRAAAESITGIVPVEGGFGALPLATIELTDVTVSFRDGACEEAEGLVRAGLTASLPGLPASLSGTAQCDRGALLLPLTAGAGEGVALRIFGDGRWSAEPRLPGLAIPVIQGRF
jgi:general secretion pathway protein N